MYNICMPKSKVAIHVQAFQEPTQVVQAPDMSNYALSIKLCTSCYRKLPTSHFGSYRSMKDGLAKNCKLCCTQKNRHPYKNPEAMGFKDPNHHNVIYNVYKSNYKLLMSLFSTRASIPPTDILAYYPETKKTVVCRIEISYKVISLKLSGEFVHYSDVDSDLVKYVEDICWMLDKRRVRLELDEAGLLMAIEKLYFL